MAQAGLKTGMYYLRTRAAADAIKFTVDQQALAKNKAARAAKISIPLSALPSALKVCTRPRLSHVQNSTVTEPLGMALRIFTRQRG